MSRGILAIRSEEAKGEAVVEVWAEVEAEVYRLKDHDFSACKNDPKSLGFPIRGDESDLSYGLKIWRTTVMNVVIRLRKHDGLNCDECSNKVEKTRWTLARKLPYYQLC